jgi:rubrerythrin
MSNDDREKLKKLLSYWVEHNQEHSEEFREWAGKARDMGEAEAAAEILEAVANMDKVSAILSGTLKRLGGS